MVEDIGTSRLACSFVRPTLISVQTKRYQSHTPIGPALLLIESNLVRSALDTRNNVDHEDLLRCPIKTLTERLYKPNIHHCTQDSRISQSKVPGGGGIQVRASSPLLQPQQNDPDRQPVKPRLTIWFL
jgi:hypothetical protein